MRGLRRASEWALERATELLLLGAADAHVVRVARVVAHVLYLHDARRNEAVGRNLLGSEVQVVRLDRLSVEDMARSEKVCSPPL